MPSQDESLDDGTVRQTYNFAPGYYGLVYRADAPDHGSGDYQMQHSDGADDHEVASADKSDSVTKEAATDQPAYKIQAMKWGLVPFWTKRNPDYGSLMKTINCRDDSLATSGGMWHTMKQKKRCIVLAQGFYEWLKKDGGKTKIPHFVKRKDGQLMCFAGLWDCVKYEDAQDKLYTYTIITTDPNEQLTFLHDRMPVILENGSDDMFTWLDSHRSEWSMELQSLLKPFKGELECYPVSRDVGKVGNNSPSFIVPVDSVDNKQNIANFFGNQEKVANTKQSTTETAEERDQAKTTEITVHQMPDKDDAVVDSLVGENNAPNIDTTTLKRPISPSAAAQSPKRKLAKTTASKGLSSPSKMTPISSKRSKNATSNATVSKASVSKTDGSQKITSFFGK